MGKYTNTLGFKDAKWFDGMVAGLTFYDGCVYYVCLSDCGKEHDVRWTGVIKL
jgi:hypothetical protein